MLLGSAAPTLDELLDEELLPVLLDAVGPPRRRPVRETRGADCEKRARSFVQVHIAGCLPQAPAHARAQRQHPWAIAPQHRERQTDDDNPRTHVLLLLLRDPESGPPVGAATALQRRLADACEQTLRRMHS